MTLIGIFLGVYLAFLLAAIKDAGEKSLFTSPLPLNPFVSCFSGSGSLNPPFGGEPREKQDTKGGSGKSNKESTTCRLSDAPALVGSLLTMESGVKLG